MLQFKMQIMKIETASSIGSASSRSAGVSQDFRQQVLKSFEWKNYPAWKGKAPLRLDNYKLRCFIFSCRDLPSADSDGFSDPKVVISCTEGKPQSTRVVKDNNNPIFN